ncbi:MAG TPA: DUF3090 family protein [Candidatus Limnocylindrales bacterium]
MPRRIFEFDPPDRFVADAVGRPGQRTFYLQASRGRTVVTVALEKAQVAVLAERLALLLAQLRDGGVALPVAAAADGGPLIEPIREEFRVGTLTMAWDPAAERVILEARAMPEVEVDLDEVIAAATSGLDADEVDEDDEDEVQAGLEAADETESDEDEETDMVRVRLAPRDALAFAERAARVVAAGRPPCPLCGAPLNPEGHLCPRRNGYVH